MITWTDKLNDNPVDWLTVAATRNNDPKITYFKLKALAEFGLKYTDLGFQETVDIVSEHIIENMFGVRGQVPRIRKGNINPHRCL